MSWKDHLDKIGIVGSFIAAACCLGLPGVVSIVAAIGLGFIINDTVLLPLMILFLALALIGLVFGYRVHRQPWPLLLGGISSVALLFFIFVQTIKPAAYLAIAGLVLAAVLNIKARGKQAPV